MKMRMKKLVLMAAAMLVALGAAAQPGHQHKAKPVKMGQHKERTIDDAAQHRVDQMAAELPLTDKQVKQLQKYYKKDLKQRQKRHKAVEEGSHHPSIGKSREMEKYQQKQEKKLRKILGDDLHDQWRANHPAGHRELPPPPPRH